MATLQVCTTAKDTTTSNFDIDHFLQITTYYF